LSPHGKIFPARTPLTPAISAGHLRAPARLLLIAAVLAVAAVGLARPAPASAAVALPSVSAKIAANAQMEANAWHFALAQKGKPYEWGGTGPYGFDCSGLIYASFRSRGLNLPRTTYGMLSSRHLVRITQWQARPGDLAFYGSGHVEFVDKWNWSYGAADSGSRIGFHHMNPWWHATMYFAVVR
jgi:cell wall-associated NlpC family hydrolase